MDVCPTAGVVRIAAAIVGLCFLVLLIWTQRERILTGRNDFSQLYVGAKLAGSGQLYDKAANQREFYQTIGVTMEGVLYSRPPFYALFLKPLTAMPYMAAFGFFAAVNLAAFVWFVLAFRKDVPDLPVLAAFFLPVALALANGQDTPMLTAMLALAFLWMTRGRDFAAGLLLSLCAIKFHMFLLVPAALLIHKRWRVLQGGVAGGAILLAISSLAEGPHWPAEYGRLLLSSELDPAIGRMPNLRGLVNNNVPYLTVGTITVLLVFGAIARFASFNVLFAASLVAGLLLSGHAYVHDAVLLLLPLAIVIPELASKPLHAAFTFAVSPPVYLMALAGHPYSKVAPAMFVLVLALIYLSVQKSSASERRT